MKKRSASPVFALLCALAVTGCSGGGGSSPQQATDSTLPSTHTYAIAITVPGEAATSARARRPNYFSPSTRSIRIDVGYPGATQPTTVVAGLAAGASNCSGSTYGGLSCTVTVTVQNGAQTFKLTTYDGPDGTGAALSGATVPVPAPSGAVTSLTVTLSGVIAKLGLQFVGTVPTVGRPGTFSLAVSAFDADGNTIVGPGDYAAPIVLTSDSTAFVVSPASVAAPGSTVAVTYSGATIDSSRLMATTMSASGNVAIVATLPVFGALAASPTPVATATPTLAPGASPTPSVAPTITASPTPTNTASPTPTTTASATPTPPNSTPPPPNSSATNLYVANLGQPGITRYSTPLSGSSSPNLRFTVGMGTVTPNDVEVDAAGNVAVTLSNGSVNIYPGPLTGNAPSSIVLGSAGKTTGFATFDGSGNLWVATQSSSVVEYVPPFTSGEAPSRVVTSNALTDAYGVAFDSANNLYVSNGDTSAYVAMFAPPYTGSPVLGGVPANSPALRGVVYNSGLLFVVDANGGAVYGFTTPFNSGGNNTGTLFVTTPGPGTRGLAVDAMGNLYVSSATDNVIYAYLSPYMPGTSPAYTITNGISTPFGISFGR